MKTLTTGRLFLVAFLTILLFLLFSAQKPQGPGGPQYLRKTDRYKPPAYSIGFQEHPQGEYFVNWQPENLASGMYIYRLSAGNNVKVKKMLLVK